MKFFLLSILFSIGIVLIPQPVFAAATNTSSCDELKSHFTNAGGANVVSALPQYCSSGDIYTKIVNFLYYILGFIAVIVIVYGGYIYMTAGGNEAQVKKARSIL